MTREEECMILSHATTVEQLFKEKTKRVIDMLNKKASEPMYQHENEDYFVGIQDAIDIVDSILN